MDSFQVISPSALLAPYIRQYWFLRMENVAQSAQRLVPLGCVALSFHRGNRTYSSQERGYLPLSHLHGITTEYTDLVFSGHVDFITVIFQPAGAKAFFPILPDELNNSYLSLDSLGDPELVELEHRLNDTAGESTCVRLIEQFLLRRLYQSGNKDDKRVNAVIQAIRSGETDVNRLADTACLGYKQFKRVFTGHIGANPKAYLQIARFRKLHHLLRLHTGMTVVQLAGECGYYDKSHLIKEVKDCSGFTPSELHSTCDPAYSDYHALFRSAFVDLPSPPTIFIR